MDHPKKNSQDNTGKPDEKGQDNNEKPDENNQNNSGEFDENSQDNNEKPDETLATENSVESIFFSFNLPKIEGKGEDADPICIIRDSFMLLSVFDGLGGAGSTLYKSDNNADYKTGAYIASRSVQELVERMFSSFERSKIQKILERPFTLKEFLTDIIKERLKEEKQTWESSNPKSKLTSNLISSFPTTLALQFIFRQDSKIKCCSLWSGDSRNYILSPNYGLQQISEDHLRIKGDALDNLRNDSRMSNFISADKDFSISYNSYTINEPAIFISTTDGCFDFLHSPMHFEEMLLSEMQQSKNQEEWAQNIQNKLKSIPVGDDCSMSTLCIGWQNFESIKKNFSDRELKIKASINKINKIRGSINENEKQFLQLKSESENFKTILEVERQKQWENYKENYYLQLNQKDN